jgi:peptidoglycan/xylan/chitin deacetylase (PgdA/CDA1 family)
VRREWRGGLRGANNPWQSPLVSAPTLVSLTFDDGISDQYSLRSLLAKHAMLATFYVSSGTVGMPGVMTWSQLADLAADGHEIGGHSRDHVHLTSLSAGEARRQIEGDRQALLSRGFEVSDFAYPYGDHNASVEAIVRTCGYRSARRAWGLSPIDKTRPNCHRWYPDLAESSPPVNGYAIRTIGPSASNTVAELKNLVTRAERNGGGWVTLVFHHVGDLADRDGYVVSPQILASLLDWLAGRAVLGTYVQTVREVMAERGPAHAKLPSPSRSRLAEVVLPRLSGGVRPSW